MFSIRVCSQMPKKERKKKGYLERHYNTNKDIGI